MQPVTFTAIVATLSAGVANGVGETGENKLMLIRAYQELIGVLKDKFGDNSQILETVDMLEEAPRHYERLAVLQEELETAKVDEDPVVRAMAERLIERLRTQPRWEQHLQNAVDIYLIEGIYNTTRHYVQRALQVYESVYGEKHPVLPEALTTLPSC